MHGGLSQIKMAGQTSQFVHSRGAHAILVSCAILLGCDSSRTEGEVPDEQSMRPTYSDVRTIVPSSTMPKEVKSQLAHNNLDIIRYDGRVFFAFRTAPDHFASPETILYVVSSIDEQTWRFEGKFHENRDLREPRFLVIGGQLFLFYASLGTERTAFEPGDARRTIYRGPGDWSSPETVFSKGFIPWRITVRDGVAYLMGYNENGSLYTGQPSNIDVFWFKSEDGFKWVSATAGGPKIMTGGVSEMAFAFLSNGDVIAVGRNEAGDDGGFGSRVCYAAAQHLDNWRCRNDPRKYDSPLVFRRGDRVYLIGRRNLNENGHYAGNDGESDLVVQRIANLADYWTIPKRCALWEVEPGTLDVTWLLDFPTAGDTCFASILSDGDGRFIVYDYRSITDDANIDWVTGQLGPTEIYRTILTVP